MCSHQTICTVCRKSTAIIKNITQILYISIFSIYCLSCNYPLYCIISWTQFVCERQLEPSVHPFFKPLILFACSGSWQAGTVPSAHWMRGGVQPDSSITHTHIYAYTVTPKCLWTVGGKQGEHCNSTQKGPSWSVDLNQEPSSCEATAKWAAMPLVRKLLFLLPCRSSRSPDVTVLWWIWGANYSFDGGPIIDTFYLLLLAWGRTVSWQKGSICSVSVTLKSQWDAGRWRDRHREERVDGEGGRSGQREGS